MSTQSYYDAFSRGYDAARSRPYHRLVDELELTQVLPLTRGASALDVATGTGLTLMALQETARRAVGLDLSAEMLRRARRRGLAVVQGSAMALPFPEGCFDVACCFKAFPHFAEPRGALREMGRVVRPGGHVVVELYNPYSLRGILRRAGPARATSSCYHERDVTTRLETLGRLRRSLPDDLTPVRIRGIRLLTLAGAFLSVPLVGGLLARAERLATRLPQTWRVAGFVVVTLRRTR